MADFALWATACETGLWPANTFTRAYAANRKAAIESIIDADPIATCVREFMSERPSWTGSAADLLRVSVERSSDRIPRDGPGNQVSRTPFDCQAISLPPLANIVSLSAPHVRRPADD